MAWVDLTSTVTAATASATWDATSDAYLEPALALLPRGRAWARTGLMRELMRALMMEFSRVDRRARDLVNEVDPATTWEHLEDYERVLGLPECTGLPETLAERRDAVSEKLRAAAGHDQAIGWWEGLADNLGLDLWKTETGPGAFTVISEVTDKIGGDEWEWVVTLTLEHLTDEAEKVFECQVEHSAALETLFVVHWRWNLAESGTAQDLFAVESGKGYLVAVGTSGVCVLSKDHGASWSTGAPLADDGLAVAYGNGKWLAGGVAGEVYQTAEPEVPWSTVETLGYEIYAIDAVRILPGTFHYGDEGSDPKIWNTPDHGTSTNGGGRPAAHDGYGAAHDADAWVQVGSGGTVYRSVDDGVSWGTVASGVVVALRAVELFTGTAVAVGDSGTIIRSETSGASWSTVTSGTSEHLYGVASYGGGRWVVVGAAIILLSDDDGETWAPAETQPTVAALRAVTIHEGRAIAVGDGGVIVRE